MDEKQPLILIVDDDNSITQLLSAVLTREGYTVAVANSAESAWNLVHKAPPALAILDVSMPGMDGYAFCRMLRLNSTTRNIGILMLTAHGEISDKIRGFEAGADDYLIKPFMPEEIPYRIRSLLSRVQAVEPKPAPTSRNAHIIAFFGTKGGVGKTTIAANFACVLKKQSGKQVALIDTDLSFGDIGLQLNLPAVRTILDLVRNPKEIDAELVSQVLVTHTTGVQVLLSPLQREKAELISADHIQAIVQVLSGMFDYVLVDCAGVYDDRTLGVLERAHTLFLVVTPEIGPIVNASSFIDLADRIKISTDKIALVLNRANSDVGIAPAEVERTLRHPVSFRLVSGGRMVVQSVNRGVPIVIQQPSHPFSQQISPMVEYVLKKQPV